MTLATPKSSIPIGEAVIVMADKIIVYGKQQTGEPIAPLTVRAEWLPDGSIRPLMYWTPDGSCYLVKRLIETMPLAFLKDRGEGLRFKVRAAITETTEPFSDHKFSQYDTYLYFLDNWYCGKNFIDSRYGHEGKEFVPVTLDVFPDMDYELVYLTVQGTRYMVEKTLAVEPRGSFHAGGIGIWHKVEVRVVNADNDEDPNPEKSVRRPAAVYFEVNKWFVVTAA